MIDMMANGHSTDRSTVAVSGGDVRGRKAFRRPVRRVSAAATSEPYTGAHAARRQAGQYVSVSGGVPSPR
ncbi:hypothetical protein MLIT_20320 [Mycolicibacterium litorale]|uniref:Uncharacterized protein n=1 Tax=Mycolicibacterium litorale TaxID=758802 RepID=A0AAD1MT74_9MYCO|nr:hypothetical protein MLIT_20320 [Mycolicibacterium litorale]